MRALFLLAGFMGFMIIPDMGIAQNYANSNIPFYKSGEAISNIAGQGVDASFLSKADLNNDGLQDLIIYSLTSGSYSTFLNLNSELIFSREYHLAFPESNVWAHYEDVNCDGISDRIKYSDAYSLEVSLGFYEFDKLIFGSNEIILLEGQHPLFDPLDIPLFMDVDDDGDMDIITSPLPGTSLHFYENIGGVCLFETFELSSSCWGNFSMSFSSDSIFLNSGCPEFLDEDVDKNQMHFVPTFEKWDYQQDGDMDLLIGNAAGSKLELLVNNGSNIFDEHLTELDFLDVQVDIYERPFPFLFDFNNDGIEDLIINKSLFSENESDFSWLYEGDIDGHFTKVNENALNSLMPDLGSQIYPLWTDVNEDGLIDIVYSNLGRSQEEEYSSLRWLENIGTVTNPEFSLVDTELIDISSLGLSEVRFSFGHIDSDNSEDLFLTSYLGVSYYLLNWRENLTPNFSPINLEILGSEFSPLLIDINEDGLDDLLIGERSGNVNYLENISSGSVDFTAITESFGAINTQLPGLPFGECHLAKKYDETGNLLLYVLDGESQIRSYLINNIDVESALPTVELIDLNFFSPSLTGFDFSDLNNDGVNEIIIGHPEGSIEILSSDIGSNTETESHTELTSNGISIMIAPNPFQDVLQIRSTKNETFQWTLYDVSGKIIAQNHQSNVYVLNTNTFNSGIYVLEVNGNESTVIIKH